ncbi:phage holin family protein [Actinomadura opuntiae]|uniref:phage holin family protein n=1 Tax=Actinomadura sp. OS1-43 TaxID=604315 RepID=UPI00255A7855|nr:phage holin family protein [Actinomadura sp. OS1-43]MDL4819826.1 phage holin family protein [Actinomadura sp. OS1-43]
MSKSRVAAKIKDDPVEENLELVRQVIDAAQQEMITKARKRVPALRFGALAGALGVMATAASYRMNVQLLERKLPPELASFVAALAYGGGAGAAAVAASRKWKGLPAPLPTETARQVAEIITDSG